MDGELSSLNDNGHMLEGALAAAELQCQQIVQLVSSATYHTSQPDSMSIVTETKALEHTHSTLVDQRTTVGTSLISP